MQSSACALTQTVCTHTLHLLHTHNTQGPGGCDHNAYERCANCVTSAPFVIVGVHALRKRSTVDGKVSDLDFQRAIQPQCAISLPPWNGIWNVHFREAAKYASLLPLSSLNLVHESVFRPGSACHHAVLPLSSFSYPFTYTQTVQVWGASMMGVGMASAGFHASRGKWRTLGRRMDYWWVDNVIKGIH